jgi:hypothetical protein
MDTERTKKHKKIEDCGWSYGLIQRAKVRPRHHQIYSGKHVCSCPAAWWGGKAIQRFPLSQVCVLPSSKNETDGKRGNRDRKWWRAGLCLVSW